MSDSLESIAYEYEEGKRLKYSYIEKECVFSHGPSIYNEFYRLASLEVILMLQHHMIDYDVLRKILRYVIFEKWFEYYNSGVIKSIKDPVLDPCISFYKEKSSLFNHILELYRSMTKKYRIYDNGFTDFFNTIDHVDTSLYGYKKTVLGRKVIFELTKNGEVLDTIPNPLGFITYTKSHGIDINLYNTVMSKMVIKPKDPDYVIFCALVRYKTLYGNEFCLKRKKDVTLDILSSRYGCEINLLGNMFNSTGPYFSIAHDLDMYFGSVGFLPAIEIKSGFYYSNDTIMTRLVLENIRLGPCPLALYSKNGQELQIPEGVVSYTNDQKAILFNQSAMDRFHKVLYDFDMEINGVDTEKYELFGPVYKYASSYMSPVEFYRLADARSIKRGVDIDQELAIMIDELSALEYSCIERSSTYNKALKEHQRKAVEFMLRNRSMIAAFEMGTGKTLTAVAVIKCIMSVAKYLELNIDVIIITPASLVDNLREELKKYTGGTLDDEIKFYTFTAFHEKYNSGLIDCSRSLLVVDEAHNLRTDYRNIFKDTEAHSSNAVSNTRAEKAIECASKAWKVLLLTATPIYNKTHDLVNLASMVNGVYPPYDKDLAYMPEKELREILGGKILFQDKDYTQFPVRKDVVYSIVMSKDYLRKYESIQRKVKEERRGRRRSSKKDKDELTNAFLSSVRQSVNTLDPCLKCDMAVNIIKDAVSHNRKVVFYSEFIESGADIIESKIKELGIKSVRISGNVTKVNRSKIVKSYNDPSSDPSVLFITKAGSEGLDLIGVRDIILMEKGWTIAGMEQVIGRGIRFRSHFHLPKDQRDVTVHHLVMVKPTDLQDPMYLSLLTDKEHRIIVSDLTERDTSLVELDDNPSADVILFKMAESKERSNRELYKRLREMQVGMVEPAKI